MSTILCDENTHHRGLQLGKPIIVSIISLRETVPVKFLTTVPVVSGEEFVGRRETVGTSRQWVVIIRVIISKAADTVTANLRRSENVRADWRLSLKCGECANSRAEKIRNFLN